MQRRSSSSSNPPKRRKDDSSPVAADGILQKNCFDATRLQLPSLPAAPESHSPVAADGILQKNCFDATRLQLPSLPAAPESDDQFIESSETVVKSKSKQKSKKNIKKPAKRSTPPADTVFAPVVMSEPTDVFTTKFPIRIICR
ncbi:hypothetical protein RCL1_005141 [Eukaryota sp. TZLM3-RCL]